MTFRLVHRVQRYYVTAWSRYSSGSVSDRGVMDAIDSPLLDPPPEYCDDSDSDRMLYTVNSVSTMPADISVYEGCSNNAIDNDTDCSHLQSMIDGLPKELTADERGKVIALLSRYFARNELDVGLTNLLEFEIPLVVNAAAHLESLRSHPRAHLIIIDYEVDKLLACDAIEPANFCWNADVIPVLRVIESPVWQ